MTDVRHWLAASTRRLGNHLEAQWLLMHVLGKPLSWLIAHADEPLDAAQEAAGFALVRRREAGEPVAYIMGHCGFWSLDVEVTPATLIPRPETEHLVELALARLPLTAPARVADMGTGSGAIALAVALERPRAQVIATDISAAALAVARRNAARAGIANIDFMQGDWFAPLVGRRLDMIVANPPYVEAGHPLLQQGDVRFEPTNALVSGRDGLDDLRRIIQTAGDYLANEGWLLLEHGWQQGPAVRNLLHAAGWEEVFSALDLEQRERVSGGRRRHNHAGV